MPAKVTPRFFQEEKTSRRKRRKEYGGEEIKNEKN